MLTKYSKISGNNVVHMANMLVWIKQVFKICSLISLAATQTTYCWGPGKPCIGGGRGGGAPGVKLAIAPPEGGGGGIERGGPFASGGGGGGG